MKKENISLNELSLVPVAQKVVRWSTRRRLLRFMQAQDFEAFDEAVDGLINGNFFEFNLSIVQVVGAFAKLIEKRQNEFWTRILQHLLLGLCISLLFFIFIFNFIFVVYGR